MAGEWKFMTLEKAPLDIVDGDRGTNYPNQSEFSSTGHCLFLNAGNVTTNGFNFSDCAFITPEKDSLLRKGKLIRNDVILTTRGTVGNAAFFDDTVPFDHIRINSGMVILRAQTPALDPRYLYFFVRSALFHAQVLALRTGSAQPQLPIRDINRIEIPIPSLGEQQAIACILGALDDKIELNRRMNRTLEATARAIFKSWFVDFDPVHAKSEDRNPGLPKKIADLFPNEFAESDHGKIPKGWRVGAIGDLANINARTLDRNDTLDVIDYIEISEVMCGDITKITRYIRGKEPSRARRRLKHGDTVLSTVRPDRGAYFLCIDPAETLIASTGFAVLTPRDGNWAFVHATATQPEFGQELGRLADGGAYPAIRPEVVAGRAVVIPDKTRLLSNFDEIAQPLFLRAHPIGERMELFPPYATHYCPN
jgi:type I restriction enzyme S subunit